MGLLSAQIQNGHYGDFMQKYKKMKLMPEFECWCLWHGGERAVEGNVDPASLPLSRELVVSLDDWTDWWDRQYVHDNPIKSGFKDSNEAERFKTKGRELLRRLQLEVPKTEWTLRL